ncbi:M23 family metallopeptidase [Kordiimonas aquimaris]|uniref:M23 family metallopeptidase n=1 Tax=Kordiimonas aquimaris TaxID=707591 RepID=UPI0021CED7CD|nr:M23 family metallopeptidase [Kordiimonas aquimaris]
MDRASGKNKADYRAGPQTQDKHKGTDFAVQDMGAMERGINALAAADGIILRKRDNMPDTAVNGVNKKEIEGKECGNALIVEHMGGWQTQYCHLKQGSITVKIGDSVNAGSPLAQVGLSGLTEFPHLHFMVRQMRTSQSSLDIDPFDGGVFETPPSGGIQNDSLWQALPKYSETVMLPPLITTTRTNRRTMWQAQKSIDATTAEALIIQARGFHTRKGDEWRFSLIMPDGKTRTLKTIVQARNRQLIQAYAGIKKPAKDFMPGVWSGEVKLVRDGKVLDSRSSTVNVTRSTD